MSVISQEAIAFQNAAAPQQLANELTAVFQRVIDYRNKLVSSDADRVKKVSDYFFKKEATNVLKIIDKYTGLHMDMSIPKHLIANWAILMQFEDDKDDTIEDIIRKYSGTLSDKSYNDYVHSKSKMCKTQEELESFASALNKDTSLVNASLMKKHKFKCKLYFDVYGAFLIKETGARACEPLTAEEITAVILHEIGHSLSLIEHSADIFFKKDVMEYTTQLFLKIAPIKERIKYISKNVKHIYPKAEEQLAKVSEYVDTHDHAEGSMVWSSITVFFSTINALLTVGAIGTINVVVGLLRQIVNAAGVGQYKAIKELDKVKVSDYYKIPMNAMYCEVLADEYVTRFGYGGHLASMLKKLMEWCRITGLGDMLMAQFNTASFYGRMLPWMIYTSLFGDMYTEEYPNEKRRYELLMLDTLKVFKDSSMPDEMLEEYYRAYRTIKHIVENPNAQQRYITACNYLHRAINYVAETPTELLFTGRFNSEYARLYEQVQNLSNNELYALAYKLRNLNN